MVLALPRGIIVGKKGNILGIVGLLTCMFSRPRICALLECIHLHPMQNCWSYELGFPSHFVWLICFTFVFYMWLRIFVFTFVFYLYRNLYLQNLLVPNFCWFLKCNYFTLLQRKTAVSGKKTFAPPPTKMRTYRKTREDLQVIPGIEDSNFDRRPFPGKTQVLHPK